MPSRIAQNTLNANSRQIINVIRTNASAQYQDLVPELTKDMNVTAVGEVINGSPAIANEFINALVNRIAMVRVEALTFNTPFAHLKKGLIQYGETIEDIFIELANPKVYRPETAFQDEFKRTIPNVKSVFYTMNWRVHYDITVQQKDLEKAFLNENGVTDLISRIIDRVYAAAEYDDYLMIKYLIIKGYNKGKIKTVPFIGTPKNTSADMPAWARLFRAYSNKFNFPSRLYNGRNVLNNCPTDRQCIFMDADFNAQYDVDTLAGAFNMDKTDYIGKLHLVDDFTSFDNERFEAIFADSEMLEKVTPEELTACADIKALLIDENWFQIYDNLIQMTSRDSAVGLYWNYFLHNWKTIAVSPFCNAVAFVNKAPTALPKITKIVVECTEKDVAKDGTIVLSVAATPYATSLASPIAGTAVKFLQTEELTTNGIGVQDYGAYLVPATEAGTTIKPEVEYQGKVYKNITGAAASAVNVGDTIELTIQ